MVLVNFPADWVLRYHQLGHAEWNGATATDMIFPEFLLLSGFSMVYSFASRCRKGETRTQLVWHVVLRSLMLIGLGLLLNAFPAFDWPMLHVFGVLQRIGLCYLIGGLLVLGTSRPEKEFEVNVLGDCCLYTAHSRMCLGGGSVRADTRLWGVAIRP